MISTKGLCRVLLAVFLLASAGTWQAMGEEYQVPDEALDEGLEAAVRSMTGLGIPQDVAERAAYGQRVALEATIRAQIRTAETLQGVPGQAVKSMVMETARYSGQHMGEALAGAVSSYGLQEATRAAMSVASAVRSGMDVKDAAEMLSSMARSGYTADEALKVMAHVKEKLQSLPQGERETLMAHVKVMIKERVRTQQMLSSVEAQSGKGLALGKGNNPQKGATDQPGGGNGGGNGKGGKGN